MTIASGTRLGPYEILSPIGAGGMGEVFRAKDPRLSREVAIKVLPASVSNNPQRLRRFEQEARAAGSLNHPNVTAVFDIGSHEGAPYIVEELLEGETLRAALAGGRLPVRRAVDFAVQIAHGLAAAHGKGIVHRDLKPENVFVTKDGRVKILDFGLARVTLHDETEDATGLPTESRGTDPGTVMGTLGYMSPEQVRGQNADQRSDIFAFGAVLYEMLAGQRAFRGDSAADTISAILREEPAELSVTNRSIPPGLERIVRHCLEKSPDQRFQSVRDVAFDLEALSTTSGPPASLPLSRARWRRPGAALVGALAVGLALGFAAGHLPGKGAGAHGPSFRQLTFRSWKIFRARLAPDGRTVVFSAAQHGNVPQLFSVTTEYPIARPMGIENANILAISGKGELAILTGARWVNHDIFQGTLARMPLEGGAPREVLEGVREADFDPGGEQLAIIREVNGKDRLEYPPGKVLLESGGYLSDPRFSPDGKHIAFFDHPIRFDDRGGVAVVDLSGRKTLLSGGYWGEQGIAWSKDGDEVLFSAGNAYTELKIYAVTLSGKRRVALDSAGGLMILDAHHDGRWLAKRDGFLKTLPVVTPGSTAERDLSWLDLSDFPVLSPDARRLLFTEFGGVGTNYAVCTRTTDGSPVVRLGEGIGQDLSPDGKWALSIVPTSPEKLVLYPVGPGEARRLDQGEAQAFLSAHFFDGGRSILYCGYEPGRASRCWVRPIEGGAPRAVTPEGTQKAFPSPDGHRLLATQTGAGLAVYPMAGGAGRPIPGTNDHDWVVRWSHGDAALVYRENEIPIRVERVDLATGARTLVRTLAPADLSGVLSVGAQGAIAASEDEKTWVYTYRRVLSQLFLVEGAR